MSLLGETDLAVASALLPPYARTLGMEVERLEHGVPVLAFDFAPAIHGRPGFVHGGAIGGLLEMAAMIALGSALRQRPGRVRFKPVNITVEYLRGATAQRTFAIGRINRAGRRIANVSAEAWQGDRAAPVATAWMNIRLVPHD
jgi:uncharacterized protein (TIGR00369 family)